MARPGVVGYCWPQSAEVGDEVGLHLSAQGTDGAEASATVEVARIGLHRTVVHTEAAVVVPALPTPENASTEGCGWPAARTIRVDPSWRSGYYEVTLTVEAGGRSRVAHAFFVVRPTVATATAPILLVLATNTWHAYNDFGGLNLYNGATQVALQRPMARGYLHKPPGAGRRVTSIHPPDPQLAAHVGYPPQALGELGDNQFFRSHQFHLGIGGMAQLPQGHGQHGMSHGQPGGRLIRIVQTFSPPCQRSVEIAAPILEQGQGKSPPRHHVGFPRRIRLGDGFLHHRRHWHQ